MFNHSTLFFIQLLLSKPLNPATPRYPVAVVISILNYRFNQYVCRIILHLNSIIWTMYLNSIKFSGTFVRIVLGTTLDVKLSSTGHTSTGHLMSICVYLR